MKKDSAYGRFLRSLSYYFVIFLLVAFVITCCTMLFVSTLSESLGIELTDSNVSTAAKLTFINVIFLSLLFTVADSIRRKFTVDRPIKKITETAEKMMQGDFSVRIAPESGIFADKKFGEIIDCINAMAEELSHTETLRTDFIANVSHEIKTPLSVIHNYGVLLQSDKLSDEQRAEYAKAITSASRRLADLASNILRLNKLENQQVLLSSEKYDLSEQLCECLLSFEDIWEEKGINIETDIEEGVFIVSDREMLSLVWNNLFSNAIKFTEKGGRVTLQLKSEGDRATVRISDTGCGISKEVGTHIFDKFYQGDTSHATAGNGLGLALVKRIIDITSGEISVESELGVGSTFTVSLSRGGATDGEI